MREARTQQVGDGACKTVEAPNNDHIESAAMCVCEQSVELGTAFLCAGDSNVPILPGQTPAAPFAIFTDFSRLNFRVLAVGGADSRVQHCPRVCVRCGDSLRERCAGATF